MARVQMLPLRFQHKIRVAGGHWLWIGHIDKKGYGRVAFEGKAERAHRAVFKIVHGHFPPDDTHHTCEIKHCVKPDHLAAETRKEHSQHHRKTHCPHGHEYTDDNTYIHRTTGAKMCRTCMREKGGVKNPRGPYGPQKNPNPYPRG